MKPPHRHGLSLIEVVASIALLATLMITLLTAWTKHKNQLELAQHKLTAVELLDQKLGQWYVQSGGPPFPASGRLGNTQYEWKSFRTPNKRPLPGGLVAVTVAVVNKANIEVASVEVAAAVRFFQPQTANVDAGIRSKVASK